VKDTNKDYNVKRVKKGKLRPTPPSLASAWQAATAITITASSFQLTLDKA
jgi:hypothetical protein